MKQANTNFWISYLVTVVKLLCGEDKQTLNFVDFTLLSSVYFRGRLNINVQYPQFPKWVGGLNS